MQSRYFSIAARARLSPSQGSGEIVNGPACRSRHAVSKDRRWHPLKKCSRWHVRIADFGLARIAADQKLTNSGLIAGTPQYMSPEQANGKELDARSDLFSLGSVMYAMCTGEAAFHAETALGILRKWLISPLARCVTSVLRLPSGSLRPLKS